MLKPAIATLLVALAGAPGVAQAASFAEVFRDSCFTARSDYAGLQQTLTASNWVDATDDSSAELQAILAETKALQARTDLPGFSLEYLTFRTEVDGSTYYAVLSKAAGADGAPPTIGCNLYDFDAEAAIDGAAFGSLLALGDALHQDQDGAVMDIWLPDPTATDQIMLGFISEGSPAATQIGVSGLFATSVMSEAAQ